MESGGITGLGRKLGVTRQTIHRWLKAGEMPEIYQYVYIARRPKNRGRA